MKFSDLPRLTIEGSWECDFSLEEFVSQIQRWEKEEALQMNPDFQRGNGAIRF